MSIILDASSLINIINGEMLPALVAALGEPFLVGPIVVGECAAQRRAVEGSIKSGLLAPLDTSHLRASAFFALLAEHRLGAGETECLAFASSRPGVVSIDDRTARNKLAGILGRERITGTLGLLRRAVHSGALSHERGYVAYNQMLERGGFLPKLTAEAFRQATVGAVP